VPLTPAQLAWNYAAFWLGEVAPRVDKLASFKPGAVEATWKRDRERFAAVTTKIFAPHAPGIGANDLDAFLKTMLTPTDAANFWAGVLRLGADVDAVGVTPDASDLAVESVKEAAKEAIPTVIHALVPDSLISGLKTVAVVGGLLVAAAIILPNLPRKRRR